MILTIKSSIFNQTNNSRNIVWRKYLKPREQRDLRLRSSRYPAASEKPETRLERRAFRIRRYRIRASHARCHTPISQHLRHLRPLPAKEKTRRLGKRDRPANQSPQRCPRPRRPYRHAVRFFANSARASIPPRDQQIIAPPQAAKTTAPASNRQRSGPNDEKKRSGGNGTFPEENSTCANRCPSPFIPACTKWHSNPSTAA